MKGTQSRDTIQDIPPPPDGDDTIRMDPAELPDLVEQGDDTARDIVNPLASSDDPARPIRRPRPTEPWHPWATRQSRPAVVPDTAPSRDDSLEIVEEATLAVAAAGVPSPRVRQSQAPARPSLTPLATPRQGRRAAWIIGLLSAAILLSVGLYFSFQAAPSPASIVEEASSHAPEVLTANIAAAVSNTDEQEPAQQRTKGRTDPDSSKQIADWLEQANLFGTNPQMETPGDLTLLQGENPSASSKNDGISEKRVTSKSSRSRRRSRGEPLRSEQIRSTVGRGSRTIQRCYEREMRRASSPVAVRVVVAIHVGRSGRVQSASVRSGAVTTPLRHCIENAIGRWQFPVASGETRIETPFVLRPR